MAEPLRKDRVYEQDDEKPVVRPKLQGVDGGGEGDGKASGDLKAVPSEQLDQAERSGLRSIDGGGEGDGKASGNLSAVDNKEQGLLDDSDQVGRGFKNKGSSGNFFSGRRFSFGKWTRKKTATVATVAVLGGGGITAFSVLQGPMELVQVSQLMQKFHLQSREDETNSRTVKIGRYMYHLQKDGSGVQNTRLGTLGNKYADRIEKKMNKSGLETAYTQKSGYRVGYVIDPDNLAGTDLEKYRTYDKNGKIDYDRTTKRVEAAIQREFSEFNVKAQVLNDGNVFINSDDTKFYQSLKLQRYILKRAGYSESVSAVNARVMAKRAGISLHPIRKLDRKLALKAEDAYAKWKDDRKASRKNGSSTANTPNSSGDPESDAATSETSQASEGAGESTPEERAGKLDKLQASKGFKAGAGAAAITGIVCMVKDINKGSDALKESQVIMPAMRIAGEYIGAGAQVQSGEDIDMRQAGFYVKQLHGVAYQDQKTGKKSSWTSAASQKAEQGKTGGIPATDTLNSIGAGPPFPIVENGTLGSLADAACSTVGQILTAAVGLLSGPLSFVVSTGVGAVMGPVVMNQVMDWVSGQALPLFPVGGDLGNVLNYGTRLFGRNQGVTMAGRELSTQESAVKRQSIDEASKEEMRQKSFLARTFDIHDYRSASSQVIASGQLSATGIVSLATSPFKTIGDTLAGFSKIGSKPAFASSGAYDYGFNDVGFSQDELDNPKVENPFANGKDVVQRIIPQHPEYIERAATCYGITVDPSTGDVTSLQAGTPEFKTANDGDCKDKSEDFMQFRMYILDTETMMSLACLEADDSNPDDAPGTQACADLGFGGNQATQDTGGSVDGDAKSLAQQILDSSNVTYPYTDTNGMNVRQVMEKIAQTGKGPINGDNAPDKGGSVAVSTKLLKTILEYSKSHQIGLNALTNATHSSPQSNHYKGIAIDIACSPALDRAAFDQIAGQNGGQNNGETCPGDQHWHYDFPE